MNDKFPAFCALLNRRPTCWAKILGSDEYPDIFGFVRFYQTPYGVITVVEIKGLPTQDSPCESPIFALHIHDGSSCSGNETDPFANAGMHYNPLSCPHPYHAGDMPPLFGANGYAYSVFLSNRFSATELVGKTIILHSSPDDFTTQPSGNSGVKIACGEIVA